MIDTSDKKKSSKINGFKDYKGVHDKDAHPYLLSSGCVKKRAKAKMNKRIKTYTLYKKCVRVETRHGKALKELLDRYFG